jgi:uncharacterized cupin superfamily protein
METTFKNIHTAKFKEGLNSRGDHWRHVDLSGEHLGVRVEELPPGATSSYHHYHSLEEEHVLVLSGVATLHLGEAVRELHEGDHVWFAAGDETAHHLENRGPGNLKYLVFGERKAGDVVVYPGGPVMLIRALGGKLVTYDESNVPRPAHTP